MVAVPEPSALPPDLLSLWPAVLSGQPVAVLVAVAMASLIVAFVPRG